MTLSSYSTAEPSPHRAKWRLPTPERLVWYGLLLVIVLSPLPFGSNPIWGFRSLAVAVAVLVALYGVQPFLQWLMPRYAARQKEETIPPMTRRQVIWWLAMVVPFLLACGWIGLQWLPVWPESTVHPLWQMAKEALNGWPATEPLSLNTLSLNPDRTYDGLLKLLSYGGIFFLAASYGRERQNALTLIKVLAYSGMAYALYGIIVEAAGGKVVLWYEKFGYEGSVTSTFINRNSYATYAGFGLIACLVLLLRQMMQKTEGMRGTPLARQIADNLTSAKIIPSMLGFLIIFIALLETHSRAGLLAAAIGLTVMVLAASTTREFRRLQKVRKWLGGLMVVVLIGLIGLVGGGVGERFGALLEGHGDVLRGEIYRNTMAAIQSEPASGTGAGTFEEVYRLYRGLEAIDGEHFWWQLARIDRAHNTYLELALTLGTPIATLLILSCIICAVRIGKGIRERRRGGLYPAFGLAVAMQTGFHAFFDFSLEIPAIAAIFAAILGMGFAQSFPTRAEKEAGEGKLRAGSASPVLSQADNDLLRGKGIGGLSIGFGVVLFLLTLPPFIASWIQMPTEEILRKTGKYGDGTLEEADRNQVITYLQASRHAWDDEKTLRNLGNAWFMTAKAQNFTGEVAMTAVNEMERSLIAAVKRSPAEPYSWLRLAIARIYNKDRERAGKALAMSIATAPYDPVLIIYRLRLAAGLQDALPEKEKYLFDGQACAALDVRHKHLVADLESLMAQPVAKDWLCAKFAECGRAEPSPLVEKFCGTAESDDASKQPPLPEGAPPVPVAKP